MTSDVTLDRIVDHAKGENAEIAVRTLMFWCEPEEIIQLLSAAFTSHGKHLQDSFKVIPPTSEGFELAARNTAMGIELMKLLQDFSSGPNYVKGVDGTYEQIHE